MLDALKMELNRTYTENGAVTLESSGSDCLDLFGTAGALRKASDEEIRVRFLRAWAEDPDLAMKILFFARDIRGGLGERRFFRVILQDLARTRAASVRKNLALIPEYGRWDDLLALMDTPCEADALDLIRTQLTADLLAQKNHENVSLLAKWLPSVNTSNAAQCALGRRIAKACGMTEREYRKALSALRREIRILENHLRERDYTFDYEKQPSRALFKYRRAFLRSDRERYQAFLAAAQRGEAKLHADNIYPYELAEAYFSGRARSEEELAALNASWEALPDFGNGENALAVVDTSGSMYCAMQPRPASVAFALGLYFAERNHGVFADHFITFSYRPQLIQVKGATFTERLRYASSYNEVADTDLEAVFRVILQTAVKHHIPQADMPAKLVIISDMEFNSCVNNASMSNFENARAMYEAAGYRLPQLVFWNVASRNRQQPVQMHETGTALVSGCTPRLFAMTAGEIMDPYRLMMEVLDSDRYARIAA